MSAPRAWPAFAPHAWVAVCTTENPNTAAVSATSSASWRELGADLIIDTRRSLMARPLPGHLPRQDACPPVGGDGGPSERTFRADRGRSSFAGHANDPVLRPALGPAGGPHRALARRPHRLGAGPQAPGRGRLARAHPGRVLRRREGHR